MPHPILAAAMAAALAATTGAGALAEAPVTVNVAVGKEISMTKLTAVIMPNTLYSAAPAPDVVVLGAHGSLAVGEPRGVGPRTLTSAGSAAPRSVERPAGLDKPRVPAPPESVIADFERGLAPTDVGSGAAAGPCNDTAGRIWWAGGCGGTRSVQPADR